MINASEAKKLYDDSGKEIQDYLTYTVEPQVIKAATAGNKCVTIPIGSIGSFDYLYLKITPLLNGVIGKLTDLGYRTGIVKYGDPYIPRGLTDDDGNGPEHTNYGIDISW